MKSKKLSYLLGYVCSTIPIVLKEISSFIIVFGVGFLGASLFIK